MGERLPAPEHLLARSGENVVVGGHHGSHARESGPQAVRVARGVHSMNGTLHEQALGCHEVAMRMGEEGPLPDSAIPVFFLSDSTGISAETMGNALLIQFPDLRFERRLIPFITTVEQARKVVAILDAAMDGPVTPLAFSTAAVDEIRHELHTLAVPAHRLLRAAHGQGRVDPRRLGAAGRRPAARRG